MLAAFKESQEKGYSARGITRSFLAYGMSSVLPKTEAGKGCQDFLQLVDKTPNVGEFMLVPTVMSGQRITLDELASQDVNFIIEVLTVTDNRHPQNGGVVTLRFRGAIQAPGHAGQDLPSGEEFALSK